jgi:hypothetical protein
MSEIVVRLADGAPVVTQVAEAVHATLQITGGVPGPAGAAGAGFNYVHTQGVAADIWTINHNLGGYPNVTLVDNAGAEFEGEVEYPSPNTIVVTLAYSISGKAYLS